MRHLGSSMLWLVLTSAVAARAADEKPVLVLDAGGHTAALKKVLFTPDGKELITVSEDKTIRTWDVASGESLRVIRPPIGPGPEGMLYAAALSPDGRTLAVGGFPVGAGAQGHPIFLIDLASGRIERALTGHTNVINHLAFSPDGARLASGSHDRTARIWDAATGRIERVMEGHEAEVYGVAFAPDGHRLATASNDKTGRVWATTDGRCTAVLRGHDKETCCVAWRPDGKVVAIGGYDQSIRQWSPDGSVLRGFEGLGNQIMSLAFTVDSRGLLFTRGPGGPKVCSLLDLATGQERVRFDRHTATVLHGTLSPDGALAATADTLGEVYLWRTADGSVVHHLADKGRPVFAVAWGRDGEDLAWGNTYKSTSDNDLGTIEHAFSTAVLERPDGVGPNLRRAQVTLGSLALERIDETNLAVRRAGATVATIKMADPHERVRCFTLLPGDRVAVGTVFRLRLFDARTGNQLREFLGHNGTVWAVAPSLDGRYLLSGSGDQTVRVWDPGRDEPLLSLFFAGDDWVAWTPEGYYATSPGGEKLMGWHVGHGREAMADFFPAAQFRKSLYRPDVVKLILSTGSTGRTLEIADRANGKGTGRVEIAEVLPPTVAITSPDIPGTRVHEKNLEVKAVATSVGKHPVTALRLLLDGRPYRGQGGVRKVAVLKLGETRASWSIALEPGRHSLAVQAESDVSRGVSKAVDVVAVGTAANEPVELPSLYVLAVGVSAYPGDLRLNYAAKDAQAIGRAFREKGGPLFRKVEVKLLTDNKATKIEILLGLSWLKKQMTQKDVGVVFFSGHGDRDLEGSLYLLPVDVDPSELLATAVGDRDLKAALAGMPGRVLALLDACHAGAIGGDRRKGTGSLTDDLVRDLVTDDYGVVVMASSMGRESSLESSAARQGYFTLALTEGLGGKADTNQDGSVYLTELDAYVTDRVKALSKGRQHPVTAKPTSIRSFPLAKP